VIFAEGGTQELALGHVDGGGRKLVELSLPTLNINGMAAANTGVRVNNVILSRVADLDLRLVVGSTGRNSRNMSSTTSGCKAIS
jgi:hypothetical protein